MRTTHREEIMKVTAQIKAVIIRQVEFEVDATFEELKKILDTEALKKFCEEYGYSERDFEGSRH